MLSKCSNAYSSLIFNLVSNIRLTYISNMSDYCSLRPSKFYDQKNNTPLRYDLVTANLFWNQFLCKLDWFWLQWETFKNSLLYTNYHFNKSDFWSILRFIINKKLYHKQFCELSILYVYEFQWTPKNKVCKHLFVYSVM